MAKKRGAGEGSIFQRANGQWTGTITVGYTEAGKRVRKTVYGTTKKEVTDKLTRLQNQKLDGTLTKTSKLTTADFLAKWLEDVVRLNTRRSTHASYLLNVTKHINPQVGSVRLERLSPAHVQGIYSRMEKSGLSARTRQLVHTILRRALQTAVKWGLVTRNVCDAVDRPKAPRPEMQYLSPEQVQTLLDAVTGDPMEALYVLAVTSGLRQGELLGLEWADIDLKAATVSVRRTLGQYNGEFWTNEPKTDRGRRVVTLPQIAVDALLEHRKRALAAGQGGRIFTMDDGSPITRDWLWRHSFRPLLKTSGLPQIRFHDLRHSAATLLFAGGCHPKVVQERLGHSSIQITLDIYSHVLPSLQKDAADKLNAMFPRKAESG